MKLTKEERLKRETLLEMESRLKGMNLSQLATKIGISRSIVSEWNNGHRHPQSKSVAKLAELKFTQKCIANPSRSVGK